MDSAIIVAMINAVVTIGNVLITSAITRKKKETEREKGLADGLQCLLRAEIIRTHAKYTERKYCPIWARENLTEVHDAYKALGGNHIGDELYNEVMALPFDAPDNN